MISEQEFTKLQNQFEMIFWINNNHARSKVAENLARWLYFL